MTASVSAPATPNPAAPASSVDQIRSARFRAEREAGWQRLDALIGKAESNGTRALGYDEALELASLYRQAMNALSVARAISMDKALLTYLDALCARAYLVVYAPQESLRGLFIRLITHGIPQAARRSGAPLLIGFVALLLGMLLGAVLYAQDHSWFYTFVPGGLADGRTPDASTQYLRSTLFDGGQESGDGLGSFATFLFSHNTQVAILTFALGVFVTMPSFVLTFYNGLVLGAFWKMFAEKGLAYELTGWLSIHGVTEMAAICIACAGGAQLGLAVLLPGDETRRAALQRRGRDAVKLMILAGLMLVCAAILEGFFRQTVQSTEARLAIGWGIGAAWIAWLTLSGHEPGHESARETGTGGARA
ncbi:stage II sporulation protein M [Gemmobacter serpentinus]|uniref:stage II sporulation protein M n=1 Tax=Gemmobacter serpentinus TaxID=2652247 RepID=UPI00124C38FC|nr:stage II sporulation protein M [Gemmobacter serpentinus]